MASAPHPQGRPAGRRSLRRPYSLDLIIEACTAAIQSGRWSGKDLAGLYDRRGAAHELKGDYDREIANRTQVIRLTPNDFTAHLGRGSAYFSKGDFDRAVADFHEGARLADTPGDRLFAYQFSGNAYFAKGDYDRAVIDYTNVVRIAPQISKFYFIRGTANFYAGALSDALQTSRKRTRFNPKMPTPRFGSISSTSAVAGQAAFVWQSRNST